MRHFLLLILIAFGAASALRCFQSISDASSPILSKANECPVKSGSCLESFDKATNTVTRSCQTTNCTLGGVVSSTGFCQNTTSYPYQTFCCCYGGYTSILRSVNYTMRQFFDLIN